MTDMDKANELGRTVADANRCDVVLCNGPMGFGLDEVVHERFSGKRYAAILLILTTDGGDAHVAYRVARFLQRTYQTVRICVSGWCKSAGTLLAVCGNELIVGDRGELGPVDVQRGRTDDLWESTSGLTESAAVTTLEEIAWSSFNKIVTETKNLPGGQITFKTAAEAAAPLVSGMLTPIFAQIDPLKLGENARALRIASEYAGRLNEHSQNLKPGSQHKLVSGYPDHGFVIDRQEAQNLFVNVQAPNEQLQELIDALGNAAIYPRDRPVLAFLSAIDQEGTQQLAEELRNGEQEHQSGARDEATEPDHPDAGSTSNAAVATGAGENGT